MIKKILEYTSLISVVFFLINYSYLHYYYETFSVSILSYFDYSEILIYTSSWITIIFSLLPIILFAFVDFNIKEEGNMKLLIDKNKMLLRALMILLVIGLIIQLIKTFSQGSEFNLSYKSTMNNLSSLIATIALCLTFILKGYFSNTKYSMFILICVIFGLSIHQASMFGRAKGIAVYHKGKGIKQVSFEYRGKNISTSDSLIYVGESKSTIFLFDAFSKKTLIIPNSETNDFYTWK